ncbi:hypothetical protein [Clostridium sp.]|uniref:hypothetical protein n=1 Tax=Clostridium sp. TaxID=1506 RepID=UPI00284D4681|nr:hypothetical protein [Clostridium sp.]MDR3597059.1 hypothetical protein [Clostridium sp.]
MSTELKNSSNRIVVDRLEGLEKKHGIEIKANAFIEYEEYNERYTVKVVCEVFGDTLNDNIKFIINIYNEVGEIIGNSQSCSISKDIFEGIDSFQDSLSAPKGEKIAKVLLFPQKR